MREINCNIINDLMPLYVDCLLYTSDAADD